MSPGPDGFSVGFFQVAWSVVGSDFINAVNSFFVTSSMLPAFNATALILVPKVPNANKAKDFRPISCCSVFYKTVTRIMVTRLASYFPDMVAKNQKLDLVVSLEVECGARPQMKREFTNSDRKNFTLRLRPSTRNTTAGGWMHANEGKILWSTSDPSNGIAGGPDHCIVCNGCKEWGNFMVILHWSQLFIVGCQLALSNGCIYIGHGFRVSVRFF
ncbi:hypothetical protein GQ457_02G011350 [Hibiscus cannabinus]